MGMPEVIPVTIPVPGATVASEVLLLVHVPPAGVEFKVVVSPTQIAVVPVKAVGVGLTTTVAVVVQPVGNA